MGNWGVLRIVSMNLLANGKCQVDILGEGSPVFAVTFEGLVMSLPIHHVKHAFVVPFAFLGDVFFESREVASVGCMLNIPRDGSLFEVQNAFPCWELLDYGVIQSRVLAVVCVS